MTASPSAAARRWLHIPIEVKVRELESRLFLACCAAERGFSVLIGPQRALQARRGVLPRGIYFEKSISINKADRLRRLKDHGHQIAVSDEESLSVYTFPDRWAAGRLNAETLGMTDLFLTWGERQKELLAERYPDHAAKFVATGTHRTDPWRPPLNRIHQDQADALRATHGRFILMPSNFALAIHANGPDFPIQQALDYGTIKTDEELTFIRARRDHLVRVLDAYDAAIKAAAARFPDHRIIVRPHPGDSQQWWRDRLGSVDRVTVIHEGPLTPWVMAAEAIFHNGCSTAIEAFYVETPAISFLPGRDERYEMVLQNSAGPVTTEIPELLERLADAVDGRHSIDPAIEARLTAHLAKPTDRFSADQIVDALAALPEIRAEGLGRDGAPLPPTPPLKRLSERMKALTTKPKPYRKWPGGFPESEMAERLDQVRRALGRFHGVTARRAGMDDLYWLEDKLSEAKPSDGPQNFTRD